MTEIHYGRKRSGIKKEIEAKLKDWFATIDDEVLRKKVEKNTIVTGGCIASMLLGEKINDFDIYFRDQATTVAVAEYYVAKFNEKNKVDVAENEEPVSERFEVIKVLFFVTKTRVETDRQLDVMTIHDLNIFLQ